MPDDNNAQSSDYAVTVKQQEVLDFYKDPNLLGRIQKILHQDMLSMNEKDIGIIRENVLTLYVFLMGLSGRPLKYDYKDTKEGKKLSQLQRLSQMVIVVGTSRSGKTRICNTITWLFDTKKVGETSAKFLNYVDLSKFDILYLQELFDKDTEGGDGDKLRLMSTEDGGYTVGIVEPSSEKGGFMPVEKTVDPIVVFITTTKSKVEPQLANRAHILNTDEGEFQTKAIAEGLAYKSKMKFLRKVKKVPVSNEPFILKQALAGLERNVDIHNTCPFSLNLLWPSFQNTRIRSDVKKLDSLVLLSAYLHQYQRPFAMTKDHGKPVKNIFAIPQDYYYVLELVRDSLATMYSNLDGRQREIVPLLPELRKMQIPPKTSKDEPLEGFTINNVQAMLQANNMHLNRKTIERRLNALVDASILESFRSGRGHESAYRVVVTDQEVTGLRDISKVYESSNKYIESAVKESKEYFAMLQDTIGDSFKMPSESAFEVYLAPQWFDNDYTGDYKVIEKAHVAEDLGAFADFGDKSTKHPQFMRMPANRIAKILLKGFNE